MTVLPSKSFDYIAYYYGANENDLEKIFGKLTPEDKISNLILQVISI